MSKDYSDYEKAIAFRGTHDGETVITRARIHKTGDIYLHQGPVIGEPTPSGTEFRPDDIVGLPVPELMQVLATAEDASMECPDCGGRADRFGVHRMRCIAEQVVREQVKVISGVADEIEGRDELDEHLEDVVGQLRYCVEQFPDEIRDEMNSEVKN